MGRSFGWPSSPISAEAATMQNGIPKPSTIRATMYMPTVLNQHDQTVGDFLFFFFFFDFTSVGESLQD